MNIKYLLLLALLGLSASAVPQNNPENWCRAGLFALDATEFSVARVNTRAQRAHFYNDFQEVCPGIDNEACRDDAYVIPDDELVIADRFYNNFVCSWYKPAEGYGTVGWIESGLLDFLLINEDPQQSAWEGIWTLDSNTLAIRESQFEYNGLVVEGEAFWYGLNENVHIGSVFGRAIAEGNTLTLFDTDYDCTLKLWLLGNFMVARDNKQCGGMNVSFDGVYSK